MEKSNGTNNGIRIQKFLSDCGVCSRRAAEKLIEQGEITVNGEAAGIGMKINPMKDRVMYNERLISKKRGIHYVYIMLNKPSGYITTLSDDKGRKTVAELTTGVGARVYPVGRLDMNSEGLLIMTNDGEFTNLLTHPSHEIPKIYRVTVEGILTKQQVEALSSPMTIDGYNIKPVETTVLKYNENSTVLRMVLYEGRNRQIRKMCEKNGISVRRLIRVAIGELELDIPKGEWRYLNKSEVDYLKAKNMVKTDK